MNFKLNRAVKRIIEMFLVIALLFVAADAQQPTGGTLRGKIVDPAGALVSNATITIINSNGAEQTATANQDGEFLINNLAAGKYLVRVAAEGFAVYENAEVEISAGKTNSIDVALGLTVAEEVTIGGEQQTVTTDPESNASATVLKEADIEALPEDSADLAAALQALAGPAAGPNGGEIFIDGFSGGRLPPRDSIREIRVNQNPFSSEFDRLGFGRIEILTKPGTDKLRGEIGGEFEDETFTSRNPFADNRPPFQLRNIQGELGGPIIKKRASYFVDFEVEQIDNNGLVNALILDQNLNFAPFQRGILAPEKNFEISPRIDFQINENNTLVARYFYERSSSLNSGLGGFDLPSRSFASKDSDQTLRLTETAVISGSIINEARFQYIRRRAAQNGADNSPTVRVLDAFTSGGANVGAAFANENRLELQNYTSFLRGKHTVKFGARLRHNGITDASPNNFAGTFTFTSLEQYRSTILNAPGAFPTQFSIAGGNSQAAVKQTDLGLFFQDDWRVNPKLTLSFGLRYETQTNISSNFNFAPRFGFAYAPGAGGNNKPKTVFRGGFGVFYDRFGENLTLQAARFNGINQQQFVVTDQTILDAVIFNRDGTILNAPTVQSLAAFAQPQTTRVVAPGLSSPYTMQTALSVERQLPFKTTLSATFINAQTRNLLRSRNVNAPLNGVRPILNAGNIFQVESTARFNQNQLIVNARSNFSEQISIFGNYSFGKTRSDSDGAGSFPANSYDFSDEYGDSLQDVRHRFVIGGSVGAPFGVRFSPFVTFRTGVPFNITTGADANGDTLFTERPSFADSLSEPGIVVTKFGAFDPTPETGDRIIPRNYGRGPEFFVVNFRAAKAFSFGGREKKSAAAQNQGNNGGNNRGGINSPFGGGGGGQQQRGGDEDESRYELDFSVQIRNLFNRTNGGTPVGNLRSQFFGESVSTASGFGFGGGNQSGGNRRLRFEVEFSF